MVNRSHHHRSASRRRTPRAVLLAGLALVLGALLPATAGAVNLTGPLTIASGVATVSPNSGAPTGSWFRLWSPRGNDWLFNFSSLNNPTSYTPLQAGTVGLDLGSFQGQLGAGGQILRPVNFYGTPFDIFTASVDPAGRKTGTFPAPNLTVASVSSAGTIGGNLQSWSVNFGGNGDGDANRNRRYDDGNALYNQGSDATRAYGLPVAVTRLADQNLTGTFTPGASPGDPDRVVLEWSSYINDPYGAGTFDGHYGLWHIEGTVPDQDE